MSIAPYLSDGVMQRQLLLLKLTHEYANRPDFGSKFQNDPDTPARQWIARVRALLKREDLNHSSSFEAGWHTAAKYWVPATQSMCATVLDAIESIKLELELSGEDDIG